MPDKAVLVADMVVGVNEGDRLVLAVPAIDDVERVNDGVACAATAWFDQKSLFRKLGKLFADMVGVTGLGHYVDSVAKALRAVVGHLYEGAFARQLK